MLTTSFTGYKISYDLLGVSAAKTDALIKKRVNPYRYAFNGQERDDEIAGQGNIMTAEYWEYDARLGRRWN